MGHNRLLIFLAVVILLFSLSGCTFGIFGLAINGTRQNVFIDSEPKGATVTIEGFTAKTPAQFNLKRSRNYVAVLEKEGYVTSTAYINREADALVLYLDGILLPYLFGTAYDLEPEQVFVVLPPKEKQ